MPQPIRMYKVLKGEQFIETMFPGRYAGDSSRGIFGRLDCQSGMLMHKENRVFFMSWNDAVTAGYRPCKKCKPSMSDKYPEHEALREALKAALSSKLHIGIWEVTVSLDGKECHLEWYVRLNWQERYAGKGEYEKVTLAVFSKNDEAREAAIKFGKKYNLPVLRHDVEDENWSILGITAKRTNDLEAARDKRELKELLKSNGVEWSNWMF